jgi:hypothetical protein
LFEAFPEAQNAVMDTQAFARHFGQFYRELYQRAVRRIDAPRDAPSSETSGSAGRPAAGHGRAGTVGRAAQRLLAGLQSLIAALPHNQEGP